jgi:hypothetical protein
MEIKNSPDEFEAPLKDNPREPLVKKFLAMLVPRGNRPVFERTSKILEVRWGKPERVSGFYPFDWTDYYKDISPKLDRCFFSYPGLYGASELYKWKLESCAMERETGDSRRVNLDPGAIDGSKVVLASTKGQAHRIYLRDGIFAEATLCRRKGKWESLFYTFPDFRSGIYDDWLTLVRADWKRDVSSLNRRCRDDSKV